jgi:hypothetical protein
MSQYCEKKELFISILLCTFLFKNNYYFCFVNNLKNVDLNLSFLRFKINCLLFSGINQI